MRPLLDIGADARNSAAGEARGARDVAVREAVADAGDDPTAAVAVAAEQKRQAVDRWDRVEGRIESRIQDRFRSRDRGGPEL